MQISDKWMNSGALDVDQWMVESLGRGAGAFIGRISRSSDSSLIKGLSPSKVTRSFYFRYTGPDGKQVRLLIDRYDSGGKGGMTLAKARKLAGEWSELYKGEGEATPGIRDLRGHFKQIEANRLAAEYVERDIAERQRQAAADADEKAALDKQRQLTIHQLFDRWAATELAPRIQTDGRRTGRKDGGQYSREQFKRHIFPTIGSLAAVDVRKADLMSILDTQKMAGKMRTANVLLTELKQMFRFALTRDIVERNPLDTVEKRHVGGKETERERVLSQDELKALAKQIQAANLAWRNQIAPWLILGTACRISELMSAKWEHLDMEARRWRIPPEHSKNQREHTIHLSDFVLTRFQMLRDNMANDANGNPLPWVFPNRQGKGTVCIKSFGKQLSDRQRPADKRMKNRTEATESLILAGGHWTAHDLRRTAATLMASMGTSSDVIDECLNHMIQGRVTRIYIRDRREGEQLRAFDALGAKLHKLVTGESTAPNIVELRAA